MTSQTTNTAQYHPHNSTTYASISTHQDISSVFVQPAEKKGQAARHETIMRASMQTKDVPIIKRLV